MNILLLMFCFNVFLPCKLKVSLIIMLLFLKPCCWISIWTPSWRHSTGAYWLLHKCIREWRGASWIQLAGTFPSQPPRPRTHTHTHGCSWGQRCSPYGEWHLRLLHGYNTSICLLHEVVHDHMEIPYMYELHTFLFWGYIVYLCLSIYQILNAGIRKFSAKVP